MLFYFDEQPVNQLFVEILNNIMTIASAGKGLRICYLELEQRIVMTKGDKYLVKNNLPKDPSSLALDSQYIKCSLKNYEEVDMPTVIARATRLL